MEEFADVSTNVVLQNEAATGVLLDELANVKHQVV